MKKILYVMLIASSASLCTPAHSEITLEQAQCRDAYLARHNFVPGKCQTKCSTCIGKINKKQAEMCMALGRMYHWGYDDIKKCVADINLAEGIPCWREWMSCIKEETNMLHEMGRECGISFSPPEDQ
jgi:hypothetical protein